MIKEFLKTLDKKTLKKNLIDTGKWSSSAIDTIFSRGNIPAGMAPYLEQFTSISAKFWLWPHIYDKKGELK